MIRRLDHSVKKKINVHKLGCQLLGILRETYGKLNTVSCVFYLFYLFVCFLCKETTFVPQDSNK